MRNKRRPLIIFLIILAVFSFYFFRTKTSQPGGETLKEIKPFLGSIQNVISTTGTVLPKNRLEVKPPVNGRVDEILVREGDQVQTGQSLAWMSSTERAALLDAARGQGEDTLKYWKQVYKPIALISPIEGEVIVAKTQPGQTVTANDAVVVLSDRLIVRAQVDETDIGKVKVGQKAVVSLDAYPETAINAEVNHIYYESKTVNNVTIYEVDLLPQDVPAFFRSGMNATITFIVNRKDDIVLLPSEVIETNGEGSFVFLKGMSNGELVKRVVQLGLADDANTEIISGLTINDIVIHKVLKYSLPKNNVGTNPFMPRRNRSQSGGQRAR